MSTELNLSFPNPGQVSVRLHSEEHDDQTPAYPFVSPLTAKELEEIRWYLEEYGVVYTAEPDDARAGRVEAHLPTWGEQLFTAVFKAADPAADKAQELYRNFRDDDSNSRLLTISADHPAILSLPWELLRPPGGVFLFDENPRISIRRRLPTTGQGRKPHKRSPQESLRLLFVVSRPEGAGFINPRTDPQAVLEALDKEGMGRVEVEFLRPATLQALQERLRDDDRPPIDIIHFDGHGAFDRHGGLAEQAAKTDIPDYVQHLMREAEARGEALAPADHKGYLLFEDNEGKTALVDARTLGELLFRQKVGLVVLSACQSAAMGEEDAMGSISAWLTHAGIPSVLAMTHSVLVATTKSLFGKFYHSLLKGKGIGQALDDARAALYFDPLRGERLRGEGGDQAVKLELRDWFLPALYQAGRDQPLLAADARPAAIGQAAPRHNLPEIQESGFFGRSPELWAIERAFAVQGTRRYSITGFGGQGKSYLALEAGHWLLRTGLFERVCFVSFASFQGLDPVGVAVSTLATVLDRSLIDAAAAQAALAQIPTLLILDNLESLANPEGGDGDQLHALLDAAIGWSRAGRSRVLLTARLPQFDHPGYPVANSFEHQRLPLEGLAEHDALEWFAELMRLPPKPAFGLPRRSALLGLFSQVGFHPLSIGLLAQQLKERRPAELGQRLEALLEAIPVDRENRSLLASLELSLERLPEETRQWLPRLGVFQGGGLEEMVLAVTQLAKVDEDPTTAMMRGLLDALDSGDMTAIARVAGMNIPEGVSLPSAIQGQFRQQILPQIIDKFQETFGMTMEQARAKLAPQADIAEGADDSTWPQLRDSLHRTGLLQPVRLPDCGKVWLRFHPTLAPALWSRLDPEAQARLSQAHRRHYYQLSGLLQQLDLKDPHAARAQARAELPNLLHACYGTLNAGEEAGAEFAEYVNRFIYVFGLRREQQALAKASVEATKRTIQENGAVDRNAFLARSNLGEQLWSSGRVREALTLFQGLLAGLGGQPSYERCQTLGRIGRCHAALGRLGEAATLYRQELAELAHLEQDPGVRRETGIVHTDLADRLRDQGDYAGARVAYEVALAIMVEIGDARSIGAINNQLATLALIQGLLPEAERRYREALAIFRRLDEPASEAVAHHQLGMTYQEAGQWKAAGQAFREAARLREGQGLMGGNNGAGASWDQLAQVTAAAGRPREAESWYRKAIAASKQAGDHAGASKTLNNLAGLLLDHAQGDPAALAEARTLAEEALAVSETIDPAAATIWNTYNLLAQIADQQGDPARAARYRAQARQAQEGFAGTRHQLKQHGALIAAVVGAANGDAQAREFASQHQQGMRQGGGEWIALADALDDVLAGNRAPEQAGRLGSLQSIILETILQGIADPASLRDLLPEGSGEADSPDPEGPLSDLPEQLRQLAALIAAAVAQPEIRPQLEPLWQQLRDQGAAALVEAIQALFAGPVDPAALLERLDDHERAILGAVLMLLGAAQS